jgi:tetratricopeptide (TPR) repeat protein
VSHSPGRSSPEQAAASLTDYAEGWIDLHKLLRAGGSFSGNERDCAYMNLGDGTFAEVSASSGLDFSEDGRAVARVDWDQDGDLDLVLAGRQAPRVRILENRQAAGNDWVALSLAGARLADAIGGRATVELEGGRRLGATLRAGEGYLAQSTRWLHFGLGRDARIASVSVRWPGGATERFEGVLPRGRWVLREGTGRAEPFEVPGGPAALASLPVPAAASPAAAAGAGRVFLAARPPVPELAVVDAAGRDARAALAEATGAGPVLLVVWASWCAPCIAELGALSREAQALAETGVAVVAVGADEPDARAAALERLAELAWPHAVVFADAAELEVLDVLQQQVVDLRSRLPLPSSFLVDADGRLAAVYHGAVDLEQLAADASRLRADPLELRASAAPFPGRWHHPPPRADLAGLEAAFREHGLERAARATSLAAMEIRQQSRASILLQMGAVRAEQGAFPGAIEAFREAAELEPELFDAWSYLGTALHESGDLPGAVQAYERALVIDPRHGATRYNLALARAALRQEDAVRRELELLRIYAPPMALELEAELARLEGQ